MYNGTILQSYIMNAKTALQLKVLYQSKQKVLPLDLYSTFHCNAVSAIQPNVQYINLIKRSVKYNTAEIMCYIAITIIA